eukprot:3394700-Alexandrium_andersonii.AAC.1
MDAAVGPAWTGFRPRAVYPQEAPGRRAGGLSPARPAAAPSTPPARQPAGPHQPQAHWTARAVAELSLQDWARQG